MRIVVIGTVYRRNCGAPAKKLEALGLRDIDWNGTAEKVIVFGKPLRIEGLKLYLPDPGVIDPWWDDGENWNAARELIEEFFGTSSDGNIVFDGNSWRRC